MTVTVLTDDNFGEETTGVHDYVVDFHATWCAPCKTFKPIYEEAATATTETKFFSVDVDSNPDLVEKFEIKAMPTLVHVKDERITKKTGAMGRSTFDEFLKE
jgi:thioredoxin-like negative regulator of GroEL